MPTDDLSQGYAGQEGLHAVGALRDCLACGVVAIDARANVTAFNPAAERICRLPAGLALGQPLNALPPALQKLLRETLATGHTTADAPLEWPAASGRTLSLRVATAPIQAQPGQPPAGAIAVLHDITPAQNLEQGMRQLDRLASIGTLSASMAHEVKNAMVAVKTFVDLLVNKNQDTELAAIVSREMVRIDSIVSQMLRFAGPARPTFASVGLHEVLDQSLTLLQHQVEGRRITLHRSLTAAPDVVRGDAYQLEQAFINLLFNALEAMGSVGQLTVTTEIASPEPTPAGLVLRDSPRQLRVTIQDTGIGIPPENLGRLFEPFFTTKPNGTGLGLPITRRIVQEHHGIIEVRSELNKGTTFSITLPLAQKQF